jgi:hypothetical protein
VALVLSLAVLSAAVQDAWGGSPYIHLGRPADIFTVDQPYIEVELTDDQTGIGPYGSGFGIYPYNRLLLDTGANSILFISDVAAELLANDMKNDGRYYEQGVAGYSELNVSAPYAFSVTGSDQRTFTLPQTDTQVRVLNDRDIDLGGDASFGGITGIVGMSVMADRVVTLDFTNRIGVEDYFLLEPMDVVFPVVWPENLVPVLPEGNGHRYSVSLDTRRKFYAADGLPQPGDPLPVWADIPFMTAVVEHHGALGQRTVPGDFLLDTGAQMSLITRDMAFALGLDADEDGALDNIGMITVGGIGGTVDAEILLIDKLRLTTDQGVDLLWAPLDPEEDGFEVLVLPADATQLPFCVFGADFLTGGITIEYDSNLEIIAAGDPYFEKVHFDFRNWSVNGEGKIYFDLNGDVDETIGILIPGDANRDGVVNDADASILAAHWQATGVGWSEGDFNGDGVVNELDASILAVYWQDDPPLIPGDANGDDVVDDADASILAAHWQQSGEDIGWEDGDFNGDGVVDGQDASILAAHWQNNGEGSAPVPEPATSTLLILAALTLLVVAMAKRQK